MKTSSRLFILTTLLFSAGLYACEEKTQWLTPEDSFDRCSDGIDNDDNGKIDCNDEQCKQFDHCKSPVNPVPENTEDLCNDGIDNDNNQKTDCQEESCKQFDHCKSPVNPVPENTEDLCKDGIDNDNNQKTDCEEDSCKNFDYCIETAEPIPEDTEELCNDGIDNDKNGQKDCLDESCQSFESCKDENGNHLKDSFEPGFESSETCNKHSKCSSGFCDSFIGKCSVKCTSDEQCVSGFVCRQDGRCSAEAFETVWKTAEPYVKINFMDPEDTVGECDFIIDWGDGSEKENWTSCPTVEKQLVHYYLDAGEYHIKVTGKMTHWLPTYYNDYDSIGKLYQIVSYGPVGIAAQAFRTLKVMGVGFKNEFKHLSSLSAIDIPDPTYLGMNAENARTLESMFENNGHIKGGVGNWDVSQITSLSKTFAESGISEDLTRWDTSNVTNMYYTFGSYSFNQFNGNISTWDTSKVTSMKWMFYRSEFTGDISKWDTSNVTDMSGMFFENYVFNGDVTKWNVSKVTNMSSMFFDARKFNRDLNGWDVSNVSTFNEMFKSYQGKNAKFSIPPKSWNVSSTANIGYMFDFTKVSCEDIADTLTKWGRTDKQPSQLNRECTP